MLTFPASRGFVDELNYWRQLVQSDQCVRNTKFFELLVEPARETERLEAVLQFDQTSNSSQGLLQLLNSIDTVFVDSLDQIWQCSEVDDDLHFPESRMLHLIESFGSWLIGTLQGHFDSSTDDNAPMSYIWNLPFLEIKQTLQIALKILDNWQQSSSFIVEKLWRHNALHQWTNASPNYSSLEQLRQRIQELLEVRSLHDNLCHLLTSRDRQEVGLTGDLGQWLFTNQVKPSEPITHLASNPLRPVDSWQKALTWIHSRLRPAEERAAAIIRRQLQDAAVRSNGQLDPHWFVAEFNKYKDVISRPSIMSLLRPEREALLGYLETTLHEYQDEFLTLSDNNHALAEDHLIHSLPDQLCRLVWANQLEAKVKKLSSIVNQLASDLDRFESLRQSIIRLLNKFTDWISDQFKQWTNDRLQQLHSNELTFNPANQRLLLFTGQDGLLEVGFPDSLLELLHETRLLAGLGFHIPLELLKAVDQAEMVTQKVAVLKQVAHFYNSIDSQMIPSQQAMMLQSALAFEKLIKSQEGDKTCSIGDRRHHHRQAGDSHSTPVPLTWGQGEQVDHFINQLQTASRQLMTENRQLRKAHFSLIEMISDLFAIDLIGSQPEWQSKLTVMRCQLAELASRHSYRLTHLGPWLGHLNCQLGKALETRYLLGLLDDLQLSEQRIDVIYEPEGLGFRPPLEEIKIKYYRELSKFVGIPFNFRGLYLGPTLARGEPNATTKQPTSQLFSHFAHHQSHVLVNCYTRVELMFRQLVDGVLDPFRPWVALGAVNMDELVEVNCNSLKDFEVNFKDLKQRGRELDKLPNQVQIDCLRVNCLPVKTAVEGLLQSLFDVLQYHLRKSILAELVPIDAYLTGAIEALTNRPQSIDELRQAKASESNFLTSHQAKNQQLEAVLGKSDLLHRLTGVDLTPSAIDPVKAKMTQFAAMLIGFQDMLAGQLETMKDDTTSRSQALSSDLDKFVCRWKELKPNPELILTSSDQRQYCLHAIQLLRDLRQEFDRLESVRQQLVIDFEQLNIPPDSFETIIDLDADLKKQESLWSIYEEFYKELDTLVQEDWISFRSKLHLFEAFLINWQDRLESLTPTPITIDLVKTVSKYRDLLPCLDLLKGTSLSPEHWIEAFRLLGLPRSTQLAQLTLGALLESRSMLEQASALKTLVKRAQSESVLREALQELDAWAASTCFSLTSHIDAKGRSICLVNGWSDLFGQIGDNATLLASMQDGSQLGTNFIDRITSWSSRLAELDECLTLLQSVQRRWVYLEPVLGRLNTLLSSGDSARFNQVDHELRLLLGQIEADSRIHSLTSGPNRGETLKNQLTMMQDHLTHCQRSLIEFLESKRLDFPRFYFLGDDDLLELLGRTSSDLSTLQRHMRSLFQGVSRVVFDKEKVITGIETTSAEQVQLTSTIQLTTESEASDPDKGLTSNTVWLGYLADKLKLTLKDQLVRCLTRQAESPDWPTKEDCLTYSTQIVILAYSIKFTRDVEQALDAGRVSKLKAQLQSQLVHFASIDSTASKSHDDHQPSRINTFKLNGLILAILRALNVTDQLITSGALNRHDWVWVKQLRFCSNSNKPSVQMLDANFVYTFECQAEPGRLIQSTLTDKAFLTLTQAMKAGLGGNPYGPAGTGKTESVKELGALMGRQVLVFNCDEGIDVQAMGRILIGVVKCGAWGCFDEFNRLEEMVLSAVSMQIQAIQDGLRTKSNQLQLLGRPISGVDHNSAIFITLNPVSKGYSGRQKLPDNLKQLFRPIAMTQPDSVLIAQVILFAQGFRHANELAPKLVALFELASQLLSGQQHYDWGLRALKTVLHSAGTLLHEQRLNKKSSDQIELRLLLTATKSVTLAKLTQPDLARFEALLGDVFTTPDGVDLSSQSDAGSSDNRLTNAMRQVLVDSRLACNEVEVKKALELYVLTQRRMGVVLIGPSGSGKSTIIQLVRLGLAKLDTGLRFYSVSPKAITKSHLLGQTNPDTREWQDGVLTNLARIVSSSDGPSWIVCDGDIDPDWIESLNSVLDDNRLLTLTSGERIQFSHNVNFIFETHDLGRASPATVSRLGVVYVDSGTLTPRHLIDAWLDRQQQERSQELGEWMTNYFVPCLDWVIRQNDSLVLESSPTSLVINSLPYLHQAATLVEFAQGLLLGLGANLNPSLHSTLADQVASLTGQSRLEFDQFETKNDASCDPMMAVSVESTGEYALHSLSSPNINKAVHRALNSSGDSLPLLLTRQVNRSLQGIQKCLDERRSFLVTGSEGCGKRLLLNYCFARSSSCPVQVVAMNCSSQTTPEHVLDKLNQYCATSTVSTTSNSQQVTDQFCNSLQIIRSNRLLRPKQAGRRLILMLRHINLPKSDRWGSSRLLAFLHQLLAYNGFYDTTTLEFINIQGIQIIGTLTPSPLASDVTSNGRPSISPRLTSLLRVCIVSSPSSTELVQIYSCYLQAQIIGMNESGIDNSNELQRIAQEAGSCMVKLVTSLGSTKSGTIIHNSSLASALTSPHMLTAWVINLYRYIQDTPFNADRFWMAFAYEARRQIRDMLVDEKSRGQFDSVFAGLLKSCSSFKSPQNVDSVNCRFTALFSSKTNMDCLSFKDAYTLINRSLKQYTQEIGLGQLQHQLVLVDDFIDLVCRIDRVITNQSPHLPSSLILAGPSGLGRRTAACLVTHCHRASLFRLNIGRMPYTMRQFSLDIKAPCQLAVSDNAPVVLLVEDFQLTHIDQLELINSLLVNGESPGLFSNEEFDTLSSLRQEATAEFGSSDLESVLRCASRRIRRNLHLILIVDTESSPQSKARCFCLSTWLSVNPGLHKYCSIQYLSGWSEGALLQIPDAIAHDVGQSLQAVNREPMTSKHWSRACLALHQHSSTPRKPRQFVALCHRLADILKVRRGRLTNQLAHLQAGLGKLDQARQIVDQLHQKAVEQGKQLTEKQVSADKALEQIGVTMQSAASQRSRMQQLRDRLAGETSQLEQRKRVIDGELAQIEPIVAQAKSSVGSIKPEALAEIRALRAPPDVIRDILEGVMLLMGCRDLSWTNMRTFLARRGFQEDLHAFDARHISVELRSCVEKLLQKNSTSFDPKVARRASAAAAPLAAWVKAKVDYANIIQRIAPLEATREELGASVKAAQHDLDKLATQLTEADQTVAKMRAQFEQLTGEAAQLTCELDRANKTLMSAQHLVNDLGEERGRWQKQITALHVEDTSLPLSSLLAAGFATYLSGCSEDVRRATLEKWIDELSAIAGQTCTRPSFSLCQFLATDQELLQLRGEGLPSDQQFVENALIMRELHRPTPLLIDPTKRATEWLKHRLANERLEVTSQQNSNFVTTLEFAVRFGKSLIIQDVDHVDPLLYSLLRCTANFQTSNRVALGGDKIIDKHPDFRLYLIASQSQSYSPEDSSSPTGLPISASSLLTPLYFGINSPGLTDQLLAVCLEAERPELEVKRIELLREEEALKVELASLEDKMLEELANSHGNILENKELLDSLNSTKKSSLKISNALEQSAQLHVKLEQERNLYLPFAQLGTRLYFALKELVKVNWMYQYNLPSFLYLFKQSLTGAGTSEQSTKERISFLQRRLEGITCDHIQRSVFKADTTILSLHLARCLRPEMISDSEWNYFIADSTSNESVECVKELNWLSKEGKERASMLKVKLPALFDLLELDSNPEWKHWIYHRDDIENAKLPQHLTSGSKNPSPITKFQSEVLLIQLLRYDRLNTAMAKFAKSALGLSSNVGRPLSLYHFYRHETRSEAPILLITGPGSDPSFELEQTAKRVFKSNGDTKSCFYRHVAMGQGQLETALSELRSAAESGAWLCLQNLHLVVDWLSQLEQELSRLVTSHDDGSLHKDFRLWLVTEPHEGFRDSLLQQCVKLTYEAPPGVKHNLRRTYESWSSEFVDRVNGSNGRVNALARLAWLHAIVQERRNYIPQGWNKFYEFSSSDLRAGAEAIDHLYTSSNSSQSVTGNVWHRVRGLLDAAIYGSRIDNIADSAVLASYLVQLFDQSASAKFEMGPIKLPENAKFKDLIKAVDSLPNESADNPVYFNLPANVNRIGERRKASRVIGCLGGLMSRRQSSCEAVDNIEALLALWKGLNRDKRLLNEAIAPIRCHSTPSSSQPGDNPVADFLHLELTHGLDLMARVHIDLANLSRARRHRGTADDQQTDLMQSLTVNETPTGWLSSSNVCWPNGPSCAGTFLRRLWYKVSAIETWIDKLDQKQMFNNAKEGFNLSDLFHPSSLLNSLRQLTARQLKTSMDDLEVTNQWAFDQGRQGQILAKLLLHLDQIQLEGALMNKQGQLESNRHDSPIAISMPRLAIGWTIKEKVKPAYKDDLIALPLYVNAERAELITSLAVNCPIGSQAKWIQAAVALYLDKY